jgi:hypothetical protein
MFAIYCQSKRNCDFLRSVTIAGVICESITSAAASIKPKKNATMPWELSGRDLCRGVIAKHDIEADLAACKVVVDATYGREDALLLEINHIWGLVLLPLDSDLAAHVHSV